MSLDQSSISIMLITRFNNKITMLVERNPVNETIKRAFLLYQPRARYNLGRGGEAGARVRISIETHTHTCVYFNFQSATVCMYMPVDRL